MKSDPLKNLNKSINKNQYKNSANTSSSSLNVYTSTTSTSNSLGKIVNSTNGSNYTWGTYAPYITTTLDANGEYSISGIFEKDTWTDTIVALLDEEDLINIFNKLIEKEIEKEKIERLIKSAVRKYHFSENFLLQFLDYLTIEDIKQQHEREISRREYQQIVLYYKLKS